MRRVSNQSTTSTTSSESDDAPPSGPAQGTARAVNRRATPAPTTQPPPVRPGGRAAVALTRTAVRQRRISEAFLFTNELVQWAQAASHTQALGRYEAARRISTAYRHDSRALDLSCLNLGCLPDCMSALTSVEKLIVTDAGLSVLPALSPGLLKLDASNNQLTTLPALPDGLVSLRVSNNFLTHLPARLPQQLNKLIAERNQFSHLPPLPGGLTQLQVGGNNLRVLPALPAGLTMLLAGENQLTALPRLPPALVELDVAMNELTVVPVLPSGLQVLCAGNNCLVSCPAIPDGLIVLQLNAEPFRSSEQFYSPLYLQSHRNPLPDFPPHLREAIDIYDNCVDYVRQWRREQSDQSDQGGQGGEGGEGGQMQTVPDPGLQAFDFAAAEDATVVPPDLHQDDAWFSELARVNFSVSGARSETDEPSPALDQTAQETFDMGALDMPIGFATLPRLRIGPDVTIAGPAWSFPETEPGADKFNIFQDLIAYTGEYENLLTRPGLIAQMTLLVDAMRTSDTLRGLCFSIAVDAIESCGDRIALGLNDMELAKINFEAETGVHSDQALFDLGEGFFKLHLIDEIASKKIALLEQSYPDIDSVEIRLAYQTDLSERLNLPGATRTMLYRRIAGVSADDIEQAHSEICAKLERNASVEFLAQWKPWRQAMERAHPEAYAKLKSFIDDSREAVANKPPRMSEYEWLQALDQQAEEEETLERKLTMKLTRKFLKPDSTSEINLP